VTRTLLSKSKGQRSTCRAGHIVAASRTACFVLYFMLLSYSSYSKHVAQNERRTRVGGNQRSNTKFTRPNGQYAHMPHISRSIFTLREESGYVELRQFMLLNTLFKVSLSFLQTLKYFASIQLSKVIYLSWQQFLTCDALRERGLCSCPVSVCPSVRHVGGLYPHS